MKILGCTAVAVARVEMSVDQMRTEGKSVCVSETQNGIVNFSVWIPRRLEKDIQYRDTLVVLCIPTKNLSTAPETMVVAKKEGAKTTIIYSQSSFWLNEFAQMF
ncbi:MAG: hypothetical protein Q8L52_00335 [bacterium]|nr:hypothetical protein [bacterium]